MYGNSLKVMHTLAIFQEMSETRNMMAFSSVPFYLQIVGPLPIGLERVCTPPPFGVDCTC